MAELKYKVGDKVRIKPKFHFCKVDAFNNIHMRDGFFNEYSRLPYCETVMTIGIVNKDFYILKEDRWAYKWTDEMIEGLVEEEEIEFTEEDKYWCDIMSKSDPTTYVLPEGYIFKDENGNVINATKIVLEKKRKEYPKTYEECCRILGFDEFLYSNTPINPWYRWKLFHALNMLIVCRDAYWRLAGFELGLGKPWKPNYDSGVNKYGIICINGVIQKSNPTTNWERHLNKVLDFPTEEMRDAFYENFKELIEQCKELL